MKFKCVKYPAFPKIQHFVGKHQLVPEITVGIFNKSDYKKFMYIRALVDSGASFSIFPAEVGEVLGLDIENEYEVPIQGIQKNIFKSYLHEIVLEVGGWKFETRACFTRADTVFPVLGRDGFFTLFKITFHMTKAELELKPIAKPVKIDSH